MARGHAEALMPMVAEMMAEAALAFAELDVIAATHRARQLHRRAHRHCRGARPGAGDRSQTVRHRQPDGDGEGGARGSLEPEPFAVAVDARRGMLYLGLYDGDARKLEGPLLIAPDDAAQRAAGDASPSRSAAAPLLLPKPRRGRGLRVEASFAELQPSAAALAEIAYESGETSPTLQAALFAAARRQAAGASGGVRR